MNRLCLFFFFGLTLLANFSPQAYAQKEIPELWGQRVHDEAKVLSQATIDNLEKQLKVFEDSTTNQIAILIVQSLDGEIIEQYALRTAEKWKLGQKDKDNGILLVVAINDRKMRIEVGQGLEGPLPDAICNRIIRNEMAPNFRRGDYDAGVIAAINAIMQAVKGEYKAEDGSSSTTNGGGGVLFGLIVLVILGTFTYTALFTKGCAGWGLYGFLTPFYAIFPGVAFGNMSSGIGILLGYLIGFPILKLLIGRTAWGQRMSQQMAASASKSRSGSGWSSGGGWFMGGGGGSSWGGGFSGGGGSFGGGGSSGSW